MKEKADTAWISTKAGGENEKYAGFSHSFILSLLTAYTESNRKLWSKGTEREMCLRENGQVIDPTANYSQFDSEDKLFKGNQILIIIVQ